MQMGTCTVIPELCWLISLLSAMPAPVSLCAEVLLVLTLLVLPMDSEFCLLCDEMCIAAGVLTKGPSPTTAVEHEWEQV